MKQELHRLFENEGAYNGSDGDNEESVFPDGSAMVFCTNWANYVRRVMGSRATLHGFYHDENPDSKIAKDCGGHDFAVVDGRYVVDAWALNIEGYLYDRRCCVLDLHDSEDYALAVVLYGSPLKWSRNYESEKSIDEETPAVRSAAMKGTSFGSPPEMDRVPGARI